MPKKKIIVIILMILMVIGLIISLTLIHSQKQQLQQAYDVIRLDMTRSVGDIQNQSRQIQGLIPETPDVSESDRVWLWYWTNQLSAVFMRLREQRAPMTMLGVTDSTLPGDGEAFLQLYGMLTGCCTVWRRYDQLEREDQERFLAFYGRLMTKIRLSFDEIPTGSDLKTAVSQVDAQLIALLDQLKAEDLYEEYRKLIVDLSPPLEAAP